MNSIFASEMSLNSKYIEVSLTQLNAATSVALAQLVYVFSKGNKFNFFANYSDKEVGLLIAHPMVDDVVNNAGRLLWVAVAPSQVLNYSLSTGWSEFPGGTKLYVYRREATAVTSGKFVLSMW